MEKTAWTGGSARPLRLLGCPEQCHDRHDDLLPSPTGRRIPRSSPGKMPSTWPLCLAGPASSPATGGHIPLRPGNVTWETLQGPQAGANCCHLEPSNPAEQKFPSFELCSPRRDERSQTVLSLLLLPCQRSSPYLTPQSTPTISGQSRLDNWLSTIG